MPRRRPPPDEPDTLRRALNDLKKAYRNSAIQLHPRDCKQHDFTTSDTCRRCGYTVPFMPVIEPLAESQEHAIVDVYDVEES